MIVIMDGGKYEFKDITRDNWLEPDPHVGDKSYYKNGSWVDAVLRNNLSSNVPEEIQLWFMQARSAMLYGCFFLPLTALGLREVYRVAELAIDVKCKNIEYIKEDDALYKKISALAEKGVILFDIKTDSKENVYSPQFEGKGLTPSNSWWNMLRKKRNEASHLFKKENYLYSNGTTRNQIHSAAGYALHELGDIVWHINDLFSEKTPATDNFETKK